MALDGRHFVVLALVACTYATVWAQTTPEAPSNPPWTPPWIAPWVTSAVITSSLESSNSDSGRVLRVGLKNTSDSARAICIAQTDAFLDAPGIGLGGTSELGNCTVWSSFALVLAGQTFFAAISLEPADLQSDATDVAIQLRVLESPLDSTALPRERWLDWSGTVGDALDAGERLVK